jgi:hypothetical protein
MIILECFLDFIYVYHFLKGENSRNFSRKLTPLFVNFDCQELIFRKKTEKNPENSGTMSFLFAPL